MARLIAALAVLLFAGAAHALDEIPGYGPVPAENLRGTTLHVERLNLEISAPGADWTWSQREPNPANPTIHSYVCRDPDDTFRFLLVINDKRFAPVKAESGPEFVEGLMKGNRDLQVTFAKAENSAFPVAGKSFRFEASGTLRSIPVELVGYVYTGDRLISLQYYYPQVGDKSGVPHFDNFASSFRLLRPENSSPLARLLKGGDPRRLLALAGIALGMAAVGAGLGFVGRREGLSKLIGGGGCLLMVASLVIPAVLFPTLLNSGESDKVAEELGRLCGQATFFGILPALICFLVVRFSVKRIPDIAPIAPRDEFGSFMPPPAP